MMKYVVIRDDDICAFTRIDWLEKLYSPFFANNLPVCFSVVPCVRGDISDLREGNCYWKKYGIKFEPLIPPGYRGKPKNFPVSENSELIKFINEKTNIEILQHGYAHEVVNGEREFRIRDVQSIEKKIRLGQQVLANAFGRAPAFFVPPWDAVSKEAIQCIRPYFLGISMSRYPHRILPGHLMLKFAVKKFFHKYHLFWQDFLILEHPETFLSPFKALDQIVKKVIKSIEESPYLVLVNHYWEYFFDWQNEPIQAYFEVWRQLADYLINTDKIKVVSLTQLHQILS